MSWICPCGSNNGDEQPFCRKCGYYLTQKPQQGICAAPQQQAAAAPPNIYIQQTTVMAPQQRRGGCCGLIAAAFLLLILIGAVDRACSPGKPEAVKEQAVALTPLQQRRAELERKREGIGIALEIQKETLKQILRDADHLDWEDRDDPDVRSGIKDRMDGVELRVADLGAKLAAVNAEIAAADGGAGPEAAVAPPTATPETSAAPLDSRAEQQ